MHFCSTGEPEEYILMLLKAVVYRVDEILILKYSQFKLIKEGF